MSIIREVHAPEPQSRKAPLVHIDAHLKQRGQYLLGMLYCLLRGDATAASIASIDEITNELCAEALSQLNGYDPQGEPDAS